MDCALAFSFRPFVLPMPVVVLGFATFCLVALGVMMCCQVFFASAFQFPLQNGWTWVRLQTERNREIGRNL